MKTKQPTYFHLSSKYLGKKCTLIPRIPECILREQNAEDYTVKRICVSDTIDGCLSALPINIGPKKPHADYHVYTLHEKPRSFIDNADIILNGLVWDAAHTRESWVLCPSVFKYMSTIRVFFKGLESIKVAPSKVDTTYGNSLWVRRYKWKVVTKPKLKERRENVFN